MRGGGRVGRGGKTTMAAPPSVANAPSFAAPTIATTANPTERYPAFPMPEIREASGRELQMIKIADDLTAFMRQAPSFLALKATKDTSQKVDRYSDKYNRELQSNDRKGKIHAIQSDLSFFPEELHAIYNTEKAIKFAAVAASSGGGGGGGKDSRASFSDTLAKLRALEKNDASTAGEDGAAGDGDEDGGDEDEDEVVYEEEELEDETDYNFSYFDNGEDYGDGDDGDEGPVY